MSVELDPENAPGVFTTVATLDGPITLNLPPPGPPGFVPVRIQVARWKWLYWLPQFIRRWLPGWCLSTYFTGFVPDRKEAERLADMLGFGRPHR